MVDSPVGLADDVGLDYQPKAEKPRATVSTQISHANVHILAQTPQLIALLTYVYKGSQKPSSTSLSTVWCVSVVWYGIKTPREPTSFSIQIVSYACWLRKDWITSRWLGTQLLHLLVGLMWESSFRVRYAECQLWGLERQWSKGCVTAVVPFGSVRSSSSEMKKQANQSFFMISFLKTSLTDGFYCWTQCLQQVRSACRSRVLLWLSCRRFSYNGRRRSNIKKRAGRKDLVPQLDRQPWGSCYIC